MAIGDIVGGPADVKMGTSGSEATIGNTTGGVTATITPQNRERIVDQFGSTALAIIHTGDDIMDSMAITTWPAKTLRGATGQQMPWLRPAAFGFRTTAKFLLADTLRSVGRTMRGGE